MIMHRVFIDYQPEHNALPNPELLSHSQGLVIAPDQLTQRAEGWDVDCAAICAIDNTKIPTASETIYKVVSESSRLDNAATSPDDSKVIIKIRVARPQPSYSLNRSKHGSGFTFYAPDPATLSGFQIPGLGIGLRQWLEGLNPERICGVWLDCPEAEATGTGLELDMLATARAAFSGEIWLSGGAWNFKHIQNLVREGNCDALILSLERFEQLGGEAVVTEMNPLERIPTAQLADTEPAA